MPRPQGHAFISYVREDAAEVDRLQAILTDAGIPVWRDTSNLWPGDDWRARIKDAISNGSFAFVVCFSDRSVNKPESGQSEELQLAVKEMRRRNPDRPWILPVRFSACQLPEVGIGRRRTLGSIQGADLFGAHQREQEVRLVEGVRRILEEPKRRRSLRQLVWGHPLGTALLLVAVGLAGVFAVWPDPAGPPPDPPACPVPAGAEWTPLSAVTGERLPLSLPSGGQVSLVALGGGWRSRGPGEWEVIVRTRMTRDSAVEEAHGHWLYERGVIQEVEFPKTCFALVVGERVPALGLANEALVGFRTDREPDGPITLITTAATGSRALAVVP